MADSRNRQLAQLGTGLDVNEATGEVITINMDTDVISEGATNFYFTDARLRSTLAGSGDVTIGGNLTVNGTTTTLNTSTLDVEDLNITVAKGAVNQAAANGAGMTVDGVNATFTYTSVDDRWNLNKDLNVANVYGNVTGTVSDISNHSIDGLSDVDTTTNAPTNGQTIVWDGSKFVPGDSFSQSDFNTAFAAKNVGDLNDVTTTGVTNGQVLVYNATTNIFEPGTVSGGGGGGGGLFSLLDF